MRRNRKEIVRESLIAWGKDVRVRGITNIFSKDYEKNTYDEYYSDEIDEYKFEEQLALKKDVDFILKYMAPDCDKLRGFYLAEIPDNNIYNFFNVETDDNFMVRVFHNDEVTKKWVETYIKSCIDRFYQYNNRHLKEKNIEDLKKEWELPTVRYVYLNYDCEEEYTSNIHTCIYFNKRFFNHSKAIENGYEDSFPFSNEFYSLINKEFIKDKNNFTTNYNYYSDFQFESQLFDQLPDNCDERLTLHLNKNAEQLRIKFIDNKSTFIQYLSASLFISDSINVYSINNERAKKRDTIQMKDSKSLFKLLVYPNGMIYIVKNVGKPEKYKLRKNNSVMFPLTINQLIHFYNNTNYIGKTFIDLLLKSYILINPIFKDIYSDFMNNHQLLPTISVNKLLHYHTVKDYFKDNYKMDDFKFNPNKLGFNKTYFLLRTNRYFNESSLSIIRNNVFNLEMDCFTKKTPKNLAITYATQYFWKKLDLENQELNSPLYINEHTLNDWIHFKIQNKEKIDLNISSKQRILDEHLEYAERNILKNNKTIVRIPSKSIFTELRKKLPKDFVELKTNRALISEGLKQHNCVASYARAISEDYCSIHHAEINGTPYTIEFRKDKNGYFCNQMLTTYDKYGEKADYQYVDDLLKKINSLNE